MPFQHGYAPQNPDGRVAAGFPNQGQMQQRQMYQSHDQSAWPPQPMVVVPQSVSSAPSYSPTYRPPVSHQHGQYSVPQPYPPNQQGYYYMQPPPVQYQHQPVYQQPQYPSNPQQQTLPSNTRSSPDPLQYFQSPPQPYHHQPGQRPPQQVPTLQAQRTDFSPWQGGLNQNPSQYQNETPNWSSSSTSYPSPRPPSARDVPESRASHLPQTAQQIQSPQAPSLPPQVSRSHAPEQHARPVQQAPHQNQSHQQTAQPQQAAPQNRNPRMEHVAPQTTVNPQMLERKVACVEIPVQSASKLLSPPMPRSPKRRKSNLAEQVPVQGSPPQLQRPSTWQRGHQTPASSSPLTQLTSSQMPPTPTPPDLDYQAMLLGLSDEYIDAAYSMSASLSSPAVAEAHIDEYHSLLATGMGCLESVLKNYRFSDPRKEARVRLRFASLLHDETDNDMEAEEVLSKGITVCERARLLDSKYAMHHLLVRVWFRGEKPKAALKAVNQFINETEKLGLVHWTYAFRFLRVSLALRSKSSQAETSASLKHLAALVSLAESKNDIAVIIVASTLEALLHLRSTSPDGVDSAQRSIAAARTHQLTPEMESMPQAQALLDSIDLACHLVRFNPEQAEAKMQSMHTNLDSSSQRQRWGKDGTWLVQLIQPANGRSELVPDTCGIFKSTPEGRTGLALQWLTTSEMYTLGFLLSGFANMHKTTSNDPKVEAFLSEGLKITELAPKQFPESMAAASARSRRQRISRLTIIIYRAFAYCTRCDWNSALKSISDVHSNIEELESPVDESFITLVTYLEATCKHGLGDLSGALKLYLSPILKLDIDSEKRLSIGAVDPIRVLASLNTILISRQTGAPRAASVESIDRMEPLCLTYINNSGTECGNKAIEAAYYVLKATAASQNSGDSTIIRTKQYLQAALHAAKSVIDNHLLCVVMNIMTDLFFTNIVGDQAEKSAKAGRSLAKKSQDKLWQAVADRMYADTLERCGKVNDATSARNEAQECMQGLPESLRTALYQQNNG